MPAGVLYVIATPLGHMGDLSPRAREMLKSTDIWAAEDTRQARHLARLIEATPKRILRCDSHARPHIFEGLVGLLADGHSIALTTDAGTPGISDPGDQLVNYVRAQGYSVVGLPGPSSLTLAVSISGFPGSPLSFLGFLPRKPGALKSACQGLLEQATTSVFLESPYRIERSLAVLAALDPARRFFLGRELTKKFEEQWWGTLKDVLSQIQGRTLKGEFICVVSPKPVVKQPRRRQNKYPRDLDDE